MSYHRFIQTLGAALLLTLTVVIASSPRAVRAADSKISCASCGKQVDKSKAIRVVLDGRVYYVCSQECVEKLKKKKKP